MDRNQRLDIQQVNLVIMFWTRGKVEVILERHADEISHGVLRLLHQLFFAVFLLAGLLWFRSLDRKRPEQKKNDQSQSCARSYRSRVYLVLQSLRLTVP